MKISTIKLFYCAVASLLAISQAQLRGLQTKTSKGAAGGFGSDIQIGKGGTKSKSNLGDFYFNLPGTDECASSKGKGKGSSKKGKGSKGKGSSKKGKGSKKGFFDGGVTQGIGAKGKGR